MEIKEITDATRLEWLHACKGCTYATFFHTPYWAELFQKWSDGKMTLCTKKIVFSDGNVAILPLIRKSVFVSNVYISMPASTYGGWVSPDILDKDHVSAILKYYNNYKDILFRENPYFPIPESIELSDAIEDFTQVIELDKGYEQIWKNSHNCHRKAVKTALKSGLRIIDTQTLKEYEIFAELYKNSMLRWKKKGIFKGVNYNIEHYRDIYYLEPCYRKLFIALYNTTPVAGLLCFYWNKHVVAWHAAGLEKYFQFRPNNLLYDYSLRDACSGGYDVFDFNPCTGLAGVEKFKEYLGAQKKRAILINRMSFVRRIAYNLKHNPCKIVLRENKSDRM